MAGFENDVVFSKNADFSQLDNQAPVEANGLVTNGQMWIGTTAVNAGGTHINVGALTSPDSSVTVGYSSPNVTLVVAGGTTTGKTITGDSGGALSPTAGNWNILGGPGVTTSGSGSTLTINSVVYTDQGGSTSVTSDSGSFATAAITLTLPATPAQGEICEFVTTSADSLVVDAPGTQLIRIGTSVSSAGGTATSPALAGSSLVLRYRSSDTTWYATSEIGVWITA